VRVVDLLVNTTIEGYIIGFIVDMNKYFSILEEKFKRGSCGRLVI